MYLQLSSISLRDLSRVGSIVEFIETFRQVLNSCYVLNLKEIFYVSFWAYFDLCSRIVSFRYDVIFKNSGCSANLNESSFIIYFFGDSFDSDLLGDNSFKLKLDASYEHFLSGASLYHNILPITKCSRFFLQFSRLWHKQFGHIFSPFSGKS